jgi:eukaryotic-like serine/threonine-protein kinase
VPQDLLAGRYRLVSVIATGGMGVVWEAWDERLERPVAIKQLRALPGVPDAEAEVAKVRAMREARITARLHHRHAVPVFDAVEHEGQPCLVMQLLPSTPLSAVLSENGPLPLGQVVKIGKEIAAALTAAHRLGIVHRDVKPGNILLTADGAAHISDFGISHAMGDATLTHTGMIHGTPAYLAPEVARGEEASFPADVFSLGSTLYAALEGAPPFGSDGNALALLHRVAAARVPPPTRAGDLAPFLLEMLSSEPASRPTMEAVAAALADLTTDNQPTQEHVTMPGAALPGSTRTDDAAGAGSTVELEPEATHETDQPMAHPSEQAPVPARDGAESEPRPAEVWQGQAASDGRDEPADTSGAASKPSEGRHTSAGSLEGRADTRQRPEASATPAASTPRPAPERRRRSARAAVLVGAAVVVTLVLLMAATLTDGLRRDPADTGREAAVETTPTTQPPTPDQADETPAEPTTEPETEPEPEPEPEPPPAPQPDPEPEPEPEPEQTPEPTDPALPGRTTQLTSAITDYYALLPDNTTEAWPRMTADYQRNHAGGLRSYENFWSNIADVSVSDVQATPPDRVVATLSYSYNGRVDVERTSFRLVDEDGVLKIAASEVLSSRSE